MSSNNRSSLDFYRLENQKLIETNMRGGITIEEYFSLEEILYNKTKAMHKEEQIDSLIEGMYKGQEVYFSEHKIKLDGNSSVFCAAIAEQYYNETFGGNK